MKTLITNFSKEERRKKDIRTGHDGKTTMRDKDGIIWTLTGEYKTEEEVKAAERNIRMKTSGLILI